MKVFIRSLLSSTDEEKIITLQQDLRSLGWIVVTAPLSADVAIVAMNEISAHFALSEIAQTELWGSRRPVSIIFFETGPKFLCGNSLRPSYTLDDLNRALDSVAPHVAVPA